jgi:hypothetical protein
MDNNIYSEIVDSLNKDYKTNSKDVFVYHGDFMGKPRMIRSDAWKKRNCVLRYWGIKDNMLLQAKNFVLGNAFIVIFVLPMPESWSKKKKEKMNNLFHESKPDASNLLKAVEDILLVDDSKIYFPITIKVWGNKSAVYIKNISEERVGDVINYLCYNIIKDSRA